MGRPDIHCISTTDLDDVTVFASLDSCGLAEPAATCRKLLSDQITKSNTGQSQTAEFWAVVVTEGLNDVKHGQAAAGTRAEQ